MPLDLEPHRYAGTCWRLVNTRFVSGVLNLADTLAEETDLATVVAASKRTIPADCAHLHPWLAAPFRTGAPYPVASRFRRAGHTAGVFYAAEKVATAVAETSFYALLAFFENAPDSPWPPAVTYTAFSAAIATDHAVDLTAPPFAAEEAAWTHPTNYAACHAFADTCREARIAAIRYRSVRDPDGGANVALLTCTAFAQPAPLDRQIWRIRINAFGIQAICDHPEARIGFDRASFAADPRLATLVWDRN